MNAALESSMFGACKYFLSCLQKRFTCQTISKKKVKTKKSMKFMHKTLINRCQWPLTKKVAQKGMKSLNLNFLLLPSILEKRFCHATISSTSNRAIKWMTIKYLFLKYLKYCSSLSIKNINVAFTLNLCYVGGIFSIYNM